MAAIGALKTALQGIIILATDECQSLPNFGDKSIVFDEKCAPYMASRADLGPSFLDVAEMAKDRKLVSARRGMPGTDMLGIILVARRPGQALTFAPRESFNHRK